MKNLYTSSNITHQSFCKQEDTFDGYVILGWGGREGREGMGRGSIYIGIANFDKILFSDDICLVAVYIQQLMVFIISIYIYIPLGHV